MADLAWVAGIIDGEGCVSITKSGNGKTDRPSGAITYYALRLHVANADPRLILRLRELFGGPVYQRIRLHHPEWKPQWDWYAPRGGTGAVEILRMVYPYLVSKRDQADLAFAFVAARGTLQARAIQGHLRERIIELHDRRWDEGMPLASGVA
jgi:hypothetical protein